MCDYFKKSRGLINKKLCEIVAKGFKERGIVLGLVSSISSYLWYPASVDWFAKKAGAFVSDLASRAFTVRASTASYCFDLPGAENAQQLVCSASDTAYYVFQQLKGSLSVQQVDDYICKFFENRKVYGVCGQYPACALHYNGNLNQLLNDALTNATKPYVCEIEITPLALGLSIGIPVGLGALVLVGMLACALKENKGSCQNLKSRCCRPREGNDDKSGCFNKIGQIAASAWRKISCCHCPRKGYIDLEERDQQV